MLTKSQRIITNSDSKMHLINPENVQLLERFKIDMAIRELAPLTQERYVQDLNHESTDTTQKFYVKSDKARINDIKSRLNY